MSKPLVVAASLCVACLFPSWARATIFAQGSVAASGGPAVFTLSANPHARFPLDTPVYLTVDGGDIVSADWFVEYDFQKLWWEMFPGTGLTLWGNEYTGSLHIRENDSGSVPPLFSYQAELVTQPWGNFDRIRIDKGPGVDFCNEPGLPLFEDCNIHLLDLGNISPIFTVAAGQDFTWTLSDQSPVPEPSTWTLLLTGVGALGAMLRRGRSRRRALVHGR